MPAVIIAVWGLVQAVGWAATAISVLDWVNNHFANREDRNEKTAAAALQRQYNISAEDATTLAVALGVGGAYAAKGNSASAVTTYAAKGGSKAIAEEILAGRRFISESARVKILADMEKAGIVAAGTSAKSAGALRAEGGALLKLATLAGNKKLLVGAGLTVLVAIFTFLLYLPTMVQNWLDQGSFAPEQANRAMAALGLPFKWPERPGNLFGEDDPTATVNTLLADLKSQGYTGINDPVKLQSVILDFQNLNSLLQWLELNSPKTFPQEIRVDVLSNLQKYLVAPGGVKSPAGSALGGTPAGVASSSGYKTIIRMVEEKKPEQFIGTLFSAKLGSAKSFERKIDDEITDMDDLREDAKVNLSRWLTSLPSRLGYSVVIRKDPVDEFGAQQSGIWATLTLFITHISGKTTPIDTVLLGPVTPQARLELTKTIKTIEQEIPGFMSAQEVHQIEVPAGAVDIFTPSGERVDLGGVLGGPTDGGLGAGSGAPLPGASSGTPSSGSGSSGMSEAQRKAELEKKQAELAEAQRQLAVINEAKSKGMKVTSSTDYEDAKKFLDDINKNKPNKDARYLSLVGAWEGEFVYANPGTGNLNLREKPSTSSKIVGPIPQGTKMELREGQEVADGFTWVQVALQLGGIGRVGWVAWQYVRR